GVSAPARVSPGASSSPRASGDGACGPPGRPHPASRSAAPNGMKRFGTCGVAVTPPNLTGLAGCDNGVDGRRQVGDHRNPLGAGGCGVPLAVAGAYQDAAAAQRRSRLDVGESIPDVPGAREVDAEGAGGIAEQPGARLAALAGTRE